MVEIRGKKTLTGFKTGNCSLNPKQELLGFEISDKYTGSRLWRVRLPQALSFKKMISMIFVAIHFEN